MFKEKQWQIRRRIIQKGESFTIFQRSQYNLLRLQEATSSQEKIFSSTRKNSKGWLCPFRLFLFIFMSSRAVVIFLWPPSNLLNGVISSQGKWGKKGRIEMAFFFFVFSPKGEIIKMKIFFSSVIRASSSRFLVPLNTTQIQLDNVKEMKKRFYPFPLFDSTLSSYLTIGSALNWNWRNGYFVSIRDRWNE